MKKADRSKVKPVIEMVSLIEKIIRKKRLDSEFHRDEVEKIFSYLLQGNDIVNPYERRDAGVKDEEWKVAIDNCRAFLKMGNTKNDGGIFEF